MNKLLLISFSMIMASAIYSADSANIDGPVIVKVGILKLPAKYGNCTSPIYLSLHATMDDSLESIRTKINNAVGKEHTLEDLRWERRDYVVDNFTPTFLDKPVAGTPGTPQTLRDIGYVQGYTMWATYSSCNELD